MYVLHVCCKYFLHVVCMTHIAVYAIEKSGHVNRELIFISEVRTRRLPLKEICSIAQLGVRPQMLHQLQTCPSVASAKQAIHY